MNFFKQAQEFAQAAGGDNSGAAPGTAPADSGDGGFGNFVSQASSFLNSQGAAPSGDGSAAPADAGTLPGGRTPPTNQDLLHSGQVLFDAVQGQKVDQSQLAGAASDILGGLAAHGNIDQGTYGTYINQAEQYLDKYAGQSEGPSAAAAGAGAGVGAGAGAGAGAPPAAGRGASQVPADSQSDPDQTDGSYQSSTNQSVDPDTAPVNSGGSDGYAPDQQNAGSSDDYAQDGQQTGGSDDYAQDQQQTGGSSRDDSQY